MYHPRRLRAFSSLSVQQRGAHRLKLPFGCRQLVQWAVRVALDRTGSAWDRMPLEEEGRSAWQGIPGGLDNKRAGGGVARGEHRPHSHDRLEVVGRTQADVDNMDTASIPPEADIVEG